MTEPERKNHGRVRLAGINWKLSVTAGIVTAFSAAWILGRSWAICDIGFGFTNDVSLAMYYIPSIAIVTGMLWMLILALSTGSGTTMRTSGIVAAICISFLTVYLVYVWFHNPGGHPPDECTEDNVPLWWPTWIGGSPNWS